MCIIIAKNKNDRIPTETELKNCFEYNSDGAGFMFTDNNKVIINKGFMDYDSFIKHYKKLCKKYNNFKNKSLVIHCRIGTSSGNNKGNTHPYIITNKESKLHALNIASAIGIAHNGIIREYTPTWKDPSINDSQNFIMKYLYPLYKNYPTFYKNKYIMKGIEDITNSKFAILTKEDNLYLIGDFITENGLKFSNTSYKSFKTYKYYDYDYEKNAYSKAWEEYYSKNKALPKDSENENDIYSNNLIKLDDDDIISMELTENASDEFYYAKDFDATLYYNPFTCELLELDEATGEFLKIADDIIVYDKYYNYLY